MRRKVLQDHAHVFCQIFMGWRMADDLHLFAKLPEGRLLINVLDSTSEHSETGVIDTHIAKDIHAWFVHRLHQHRIPLDEIKAAMLVVNIKKTVPVNHKFGIAFDWTCKATIATTDREYSAHLAEPHTWIPMP